jgi:peptidoglycan L-alanyl-D-glutamate endopeptidase CwlK
MFKLDQASEINLRGVHPDLERVVRKAAELSPIPFRVTEGTRTLARQRQLKASGASKTLNSRHLTGHAVDIVPMVDVTGDGKVTGDDMWHHSQLVKLSPYIKAAFKACGVPYTWGGDWKNAWDKPHWELPWGRYPIRTAGADPLGGLSPELLEALTDAFEDEPMQQVFTETTKQIAAAGVSAAGGAGLLIEAAKNLEQAQTFLNAGTVIGTVIGGLMIVGAALTVWEKYKAIRGS